MGGQVGREEPQPRAHVVSDRGLHTRGRRQHWVNEQDGGGVVPIVPVDVHFHTYDIIVVRRANSMCNPGV